MTQPPVYGADGREVVCPGLHGNRHCGRPIPDNAIRCPKCIRDFADRLRWLARNWHELDRTIRRQTKIAATIAKTKRDPRAIHGPLCHIDSACTHDSCEAIVWSRITSTRVAREEEPIPNEDAGILNLHAIEIQWAAINTLTTWARVIEDDYGHPIPHDPRPPAKPAPMLADVASQPVERCPMTDLMTSPIPMCGCPAHQKETA